MKVLLSAAAHARVADRLAALELPLVMYEIGADGAIAVEGKPLALDVVDPEIVWMSLDTFASGQLRTMFRVVSNPSVKWMQTFNAGLDLPIYRQIFERGVRISNSNAQAVAIAEYVLAQVLAEWHPIAEQRAAQAAREWKRIGFRELSQSTWLIIGYGNIGREIARRAKGFGARVVGVRRDPAPDAFADQMTTMPALPDLLPNADIVVLATALTEATRNIADASFFASMKTGAFVVNVGRGGLLVEKDLLPALDRDQPKLAILDVFEVEPLPQDSPLWAHKKVRLTAHTSASSAGTGLRGDQLFVDNLKLYAAGAPLINEVTSRTFG